MITLSWFLVSLRYYNERLQNSCFARDAREHFQMHFYAEQSFLISFIIKTQNVVRKMPQMGLEIRGRTVGLVNKRYMLFLYFYHSINFFYAHTGISTK